MVQANADGRPRSRRALRSEEQAPLVESCLSGSAGYQGTPHPGTACGALRDFLLTWTAEGPILLGVPNGQKGGTGGGRLGSGALGSHARCGARRYSFVGLGFQKPGFLI